MGKPSPPEPSLLFTGILYHDNSSLSRAREMLVSSCGDIFLESESYPWDYSVYYRDELGGPVNRAFIFFKNLIDPGILADVKLMTNDIEAALSVKGKRTINIDPGCLTLAKVVLASTKNYAHRIYLNKGIYAEVTLVFGDGTYKPHIFTYRDYQDIESVAVLLKAREMLKEMLDNAGFV
jgi:hypothetical protein